MYEVKLKKDFERITFNGTQELIDFIKDTPAGNYSVDYKTSEEFCNFSWNETLEMLRSGWQYGVSHVEKVADEIREILIPGSGLDASIQWDVTGDFIDVGTYITGQPECWGYMVDMENRNKPEINILVNAGFNCDVASYEVFYKGSVLTSLIDILQRDYRVNLKAYIPISDCLGKDYLMEMVVNMQNEYSRDMIAFLIANTSYLRRAAFAVLEKVCNVPNCHGYGRSAKIPASEIPKNSIVFEAQRGGQWEFQNITNGIEYIKEVLKDVAKKAEVID